MVYASLIAFLSFIYSIESVPAIDFNFNKISFALLILPRVIYNSPKYSCAPRCLGSASNAIM